MKPLQSVQGLFHTLTFPSSGAKSINQVAQQLRTAVRHNHYRVRHVDGQRIKRELVISAPTRTVAQGFVEQLYGDAWFLSCVKV
ncbi:hypothetical protein KUF54_03055 [Comamonas sp. Y33R10-2]|uniref:hypothetical protein n=1 Tax=Comamonas sp. Y33R10-2 TaxID=2853257 RepID=UPI001C5C92C5|nr:hypothetical protein [Comamonas sp. Y33R10-2]QXZ11476.1 hypothetical protein KUF54_03055 [Comamonas sp. Y33R10-2]